jgi:3-hydroxyisobutyrate dehydrogenase-like beta-hydroxyacid dehydrogenase
VTESIASVPKAQWAHKPIVIETSTLPMADKDACAQALGKLGITTLDAPISGTAVRIKERAWTFFVSGKETAYRKVVPVLQVFTDKVSFVGPYGNGTKMKFAANHLVAIYNVAYAESVTLARKMGLNPQDVLDLFGNSPVLGTGVMRLRMPMMLKRQYSPATMKVEVWQKDMQVIGDMAKSVDCPTPLFSTCAAIYTSAMALGLAMEDTASTAEVMSAMAGIAPAKGRCKKLVKP